MGTNLMRALLLTSASVAMVVTAAPTVAYAQEATYQIDIPAQSMGDALRALGKATKQNIVFNGSLVKGKRSAAVRGRMSASEALNRMLQGSGLKMSRGAGGGLVVAQGGNGDAAPARGDVPVAPSRVSVSANASTVVDARTGGALKGALIELVDTGETTSTGDLGEFRFPGKNGSFNLRISYLGYPKYEQFVELKDGSATTGILLSDGSASNEIVVTAYQSGRAQALNQERTAENTSTVISSDLLGQFDGATVSDALRRVAGVTFVPDKVTGDGANVIVRGLGPDYNMITLNGLRLPVGDGKGRSPSLDNLLADSVSQITINKTLLPNQDGSGTGGLIEIVTKGPLDRPNRYFNFSVEKAAAGRDFLDDLGAAGTASFKFGASRNFGVSLSAQYRKRDLITTTLSNSLRLAQYLPLTQGGRTVTSLAGIDPTRAFPFEEGVDEAYASLFNFTEAASSVENLSITAAMQWQIGSHTDLRLDFNRSSSDVTDSSTFLNFNPSAGFRRIAREDLGGELRYSQVWESFSQPGLRASIDRGFAYSRSKDVTSTLSFKGATTLGALEAKYAAGWAQGRSGTPSNFAFSLFPNSSIIFDRTHLIPEVVANTVAGRIVSPYLPATGEVAPPAFSASGFDLVNSPSLYSFFPSVSQNLKGRNERLTASSSLKYSFPDSIIRYLEVGFFFERSENRDDVVGQAEILNPPLDSSMLGLDFVSGPLDRIGRSGAFQVIDRRSGINLYRDIVAGTNPLLTLTPSPIDELSLRESTVERDLAGYFQGHFKIGKLELVGGARIEQVRTISSTQIAIAIFDENGIFDQDFFDQTRQILSLSGTQTSVLPRAMANFRFNENLVLRLGYYRSIARPPISLLNNAVSYYLDLRPFYGPDGNQPTLNIGSGNENLRAAITDNLDASLEWYSDDIGVVKIGAFYKPTRRSIFSSEGATQNTVPDGVALPDDPRFLTPNLFITYTRPENSSVVEHVWGLEASVERKFNFLPGALGGLGIFANYTYSDGSRRAQLPYAFATGGFVTIDGLPYPGQAKHSGTLAMTYARGGWDGSLSYTYQGKRFSTAQAFGLHLYNSAIDSLDFKLQYGTKLAGTQVRIFFEGSDLLKGPSDPRISSQVGEFARESRYFGGRTARVGASVSF